MISVFINGAATPFEAPLSIAELVGKMQLSGRRIALECNGKIVPRSQFDGHLIADGDRLEIVVAVGGG